ncbi:DUF2752 domain-containing protein [Mycobacterium numidiamassiliense]|uniref:DUF2752 domain-containing protein n=1 Tax=Mycobacterium numidiamassiliense TaxID=1841861 RepID=UPI001FEB4FB3|nr:DUF2752 domain-containing protein [Mycobacterium numidiamassiliense]
MTELNPGARPAHRHRVPAAVGAGVLFAGALGYVGLVNPHDPHSAYPLCPFKWLTGWNCPLCGGLRMTHDLLHADLPASINDNVFALIGLPVLAAWVLLRLRRGQQPLPMAAALVIGVAATVWTVVRNLPGFPLVPTILSG